MALSLSIKAGIRGNHTNALDLGTADLPVDVQAAIALANGTGANQADLYWSDTRTIAASATDSMRSRPARAICSISSTRAPVRP